MIQRRDNRVHFNVYVSINLNANTRISWWKRKIITVAISSGIVWKGGLAGIIISKEREIHNSFKITEADTQSWKTHFNVIKFSSNF